MADKLLPALFGHSAISVPVATEPARVATCLIGHGDVYDGGLYKVEGTLMIDASPDIPVARKVRLICVRSGRMVRETWSDPQTGDYSFTHVRQGPWLVVAHDYTNSYNAVVADNISGVLM